MTGAKQDSSPQQRMAALKAKSARGRAAVTDATPVSPCADWIESSILGLLALATCLVLALHGRWQMVAVITFFAGFFFASALFERRASIKPNGRYL